MNATGLRPRADGCLSDLVIDQLMAGELGGTRAAAAAAHLDLCAACRARRAEIQAVPAQAPDPSWLAVQTALPDVAPPVRARFSFGRRVALGGAAVAAVAAVLVLAPRLRPAVEPEQTDTTRIKGGPLGLELFVRRSNGEADPISADTPLRAGDEIGFRVRASEAGHLVVVGLDSAGQVSRYAPAEPGRIATALATPGMHVLDRSVILDGATGVEKVVAVSCATEAGAALVLAAARAALSVAGGDPARVGRLDVPCAQAVASFRKDPAR